MKATEDEKEEELVKTEETTTASVSVSGNERRKHPKSFIGRHRLNAALSHRDNQIQIIQDELNQLDSIDPPSTLCNELISRVESAPDPLLPMTSGPVDMSWERWWLGGASSSTSHRRWL